MVVRGALKRGWLFRIGHRTAPLGGRDRPSDNFLIEFTIAALVSLTACGGGGSAAGPPVGGSQGPSAPSSSPSPPPGLPSSAPVPSPTSPPTSSPQLAYVQLPQGFGISLVSARVPGARFLAVAPNGDVLVSEIDRGQVVAVKPGADPNAAPPIVVAGLSLPNGLAFRGDDLYIASWIGVTVVRNYPSGNIQQLFSGMPTNADHNARAIALGFDGSIYLSSGSDCNVCTESDQRLATVMRLSPDGSNPIIYASGLRNASGLAFDSAGRLWATVNQRDNLTPSHTDLPVDELDNVQAGANYGWPACYPDQNGQRRPNPEFAGASCAAFLPSTFGFQAHSAPLQLAFYYGSQFPARYSGALFVAFHGSWNREPKTGYKIVSVLMSAGQPISVEDFASGWLASDGNTVRGRPVGVAVAPDGSLYVSDDLNGAVYRIFHS